MMTAHSYTGIRTPVSGGKMASSADRSMKNAIVSSARGSMVRFDALSTDQLLEAMSEEQKAGLAAKLSVKATPAKATTTAKADGASLKESLAKGFNAGRDVERARIKAVAEVAIERGQAADAMRMLATDAEAPAIVAKLKETNLLADAMRKRFGGAA